MSESGGDGGMLAEIARKAHQHDFRRLSLRNAHQLGGVIARAVINTDDFPG